MKSTIFTYLFFLFLSLFSANARHHVQRDLEQDKQLLLRDVVATRGRSSFSRGSFSSEVPFDEATSALGQRRRPLPAYPKEKPRQRVSLSPGRKAKEPSELPRPQSVDNSVPDWQVDAQRAMQDVVHQEGGRSGLVRSNAIREQRNSYQRRDVDELFDMLIARGLLNDDLEEYDY